LQKEQIEEIEKTGKPVDHLTIYAPIGGIVIAKHANAGDYVETGAKIYTIADLSEVWVKLDAYELDLAWLRYGQQVEFTTEAYPGEVFKGTISFIDPVLNPMTRTVKVRVNVTNPDRRLKPEMFVRAVVLSKIAGGGMVMDENMAGKWICPMHPSVVKTGPDKCDICGMDLVTTESLGYVAAEQAGEPPLVIPASAALITGKRAVVYVRLEGKDKPTFEGREIVLGPRAGDYYLVKEGLEEGEQVVTKGNFKIDASLQIQAKPSMMNPEGGAAPTGHQHGGGQMKQETDMSDMEHKNHKY
jgi:Cu(I)/Ag(I) efflux system membrane fusion protein